MTKPKIVQTTSGIVFKLYKKTMRQQPLPGHDLNWSPRSFIRSAFQGVVDFVPAGYNRVTPAQFWGPSLDNGWDVTRTSKSIRIGCMRFSGRNYAALRRWALGRAK